MTKSNLLAMVSEVVSPRNEENVIQSRAHKPIIYMFTKTNNNSIQNQGMRIELPKERKEWGPHLFFIFLKF